MRRSEITPELIELSKKAKALGFPQDVGEGDFIRYCDNIILVNANPTKIGIDENQLFKGYILILSFSRCLEWLRDRMFDDADLSIGEDDFMFQVVWVDENCIRAVAYTHHEAIAKAVVKILEEK